MKTKKFWKIIAFIAIVLVLFTSCAHQYELEPYMPYSLYGFWSGLWHGIIIGFSFIGSWFNSDIVIYSAENNGFWYDFGFLLGTGIFFGGTTRATTK